MAAYTDSLGLEEITPGDQAGLWGNTTNNNLALIDQAIAGVTPVYLDSKSGFTYVLTDYNGAFDEARAAVINVTYAIAQATGANIIQVPSAQKLYVFRNSSGQSIVVQTVAAGSTVTLANGEATLVFCDGVDTFPGIATSGVGTLTVPYGGTGVTSFGGSPGFVYTAGGTSALGVVTAVNLAAAVTGTLPVANGGTGKTTITSGSIVTGNGTGATGELVGSSAGQVPTWNGSTWLPATPTTSGVSSLIAGSGISVSSSTGAVTVSNSGVTSLTAGTGISVNASSGGVTVTNTGPTLSATQTFTGANTFSTGAAIAGSTNGSSASSGYVGQTVTASGSGVALVSGVTAVIATLSLPAGDWDIFGQASVNFANLTSFICGVNTTTTIAGSIGIYNGVSFGPISMPIPLTPTVVSSTTPIYLLMNVGFTSGSPTGNGQIFARRVR